MPAIIFLVLHYLSFYIYHNDHYNGLFFFDILDKMDKILIKEKITKFIVTPYETLYYKKWLREFKIDEIEKTPLARLAGVFVNFWDQGVNWRVTMAR